MCEYDLTGLIEPQCPECGYRFEWETTGRSEYGELPWLFEHGGGYLRTQWRMLRLGSFWRAVQPGMKVRTGRLILFHLIGWGVVLLLPLLIVAGPFTWERVKAVESQRRSFVSGQRTGLRQVSGDTPEEQGRSFDALYGPRGSQFWWLISGSLQAPLHRGTFWQMWTALLAMPLTVLVSMAAMWQTVGRRKVRHRHFLRVAVYSADLLPVGLFMVGLTAWEEWRVMGSTVKGTPQVVAGLMYQPVRIAGLVFTGLVAWRVAVGMKSYFRDRWAWAAAAGMVAMAVGARWWFLEEFGLNYWF